MYLTEPSPPPSEVVPTVAMYVHFHVEGSKLTCPGSHWKVAGAGPPCILPFAEWVRAEHKMGMKRPG